MFESKILDINITNFYRYIELIKEIYKHSVAKCLDSLFGQELHDIQRNFNKLYSFGNQD